MKNTSELVSGEVYLLSALAALQKVVETLPHFISPYLEGVLSQVSHSDLNMLSGVAGGAGITNLTILFISFSFYFSGRLLFLKRYLAF